MNAEDWDLLHTIISCGSIPYLFGTFQEVLGFLHGCLGGIR